MISKRLMFDGTWCYTGSTCRTHAGAIREAKLVAKQSIDRTREENEFIARRQWHPAKNLVGYDEVRTNDANSWWQCPVARDHVWQASKNKRTSRGDGCPFCSGHRASSTNNLTLRPELAAELDEEAAGVTARELTIASNRNVPWRCRTCGHTWNATPNTRQASGCPKCMVRTGGFILTFETSLAGRHLEIAKEFDVEKNGLTAAQVGASDKKIYSWRCSAKGHSYPMSILNRVRPTASCPVCQNRRITPENSLRALFPQVASELNEVRSGMTANKIAPGSARRLFWNCPTGNPDHLYDASPRERTGSTVSGKPTGCPFCSNHRLSKTNSLAAVAPEIALEFDEEKNGCKAEDVIAGSNTPMWWNCLAGKGHKSWKTSPNLRTGKGKTGCPRCSPWSTSKPEALFRGAFARSSAFGAVVQDNNATVPIRMKNNRDMKVDVLATLQNGDQVVAEYDGAYYHRSDESLIRDTWKTIQLLNAGYLVVRIRENALPQLDLIHPNLFQLNHSAKRSHAALDETVLEVEKWLANL